MPTRKEVNTEITKRMVAQWGSRTPLFLENQRLENNTNQQPTVDEAPVGWVRLVVKFGNTPSQTYGPVGGRRYRRTGMIGFQVFTPLLNGTGMGSGYCEDIINIFEGQSLPGMDVQFYEGDYSSTGESGSWFQFNGTVTFNFGEIK